jgi:hypothetical protein
MYRAIADRLMQLASDHATQIAEQWYKAVTTNSKTPAYKSLSKEDGVRYAELVCRNLSTFYFAESCEKAVADFLSAHRYVEDRFSHDIPLNQVVYAIIMLRRHLWLYAEFQALYTTTEDLMQMMDSINRVLLVFDYIIFVSSTRYLELQAMSQEQKAIHAGR